MFTDFTINLQSRFFSLFPKTYFTSPIRVVLYTSTLSKGRLSRAIYLSHGAKARSVLYFRDTRESAAALFCAQKISQELHPRIRPYPSRARDKARLKPGSPLRSPRTRSHHELGELVFLGSHNTRQLLHRDARNT